MAAFGARTHGVRLPGSMYLHLDGLRPLSLCLVRYRVVMSVYRAFVPLDKRLCGPWMVSNGGGSLAHLVNFYE
jgi:hypothetical protein